MQNSEIDLAIEALLFASPEPLTQQRVNLVFDEDAPNLEEVATRLSKKYSEHNHAFELQAVAGGYQLRTREMYDVWVRRLLNKSGQLQLSQAALETLAIVAYKQPLSRYDVEAIRGVDCTGVLKTLLSKILVRIMGRDEGPGRPLLYGTTEEFLQGFGINRIGDLPKLKEITELLDEQPALTDQIDAFK